MQMDASGDFANGSGFILYGAVNCPGLGGGYAASGPAYFDIDGNFNMTVTYANGAQIVCGRLNRQTLSGFCTVNNSTGAQVGSVTVNFR